jgi:hypothetical protein
LTANIVEIAATFFSYLSHHGVISDPHLKPQFDRITSLARSAPRKLKEAKHLEDCLGHAKKWNRAMWSIWGGSYCSSAASKLVSQAQVQRSNDVDDLDDGGWGAVSGRWSPGLY